MSLFDVREQIIVNERGIYWRRWSETPIPWHEICAIRVRRIKLTRFLCLWLRHPEAYGPKRSIPGLARMNRARGFGDVAIVMTGLNRSVDDLTQAIGHYWADGEALEMQKPPEIRRLA